jgi:hypothetical protein
MPSACAVGRVVVVLCWPQSRHRQIAVSTDAIASMLITSVAGRQTVTVMVCSFPERWVTSVRKMDSRVAVAQLRRGGAGNRGVGPVGRGERRTGGWGSTRGRPGLGEISAGSLALVQGLVPGLPGLGERHH